MYLYILAFSIERIRSNNISIASSTSTAQTLVPRYHPQLREPRLLGKTADSRAAAGEIQDESGNLFCQKVSKCSTNDGDKSKGQGERPSTGRITNNFSIKVNHNPLDYIKINKSKLM